MIDMAAYDREMEAERVKRDGYRAFDYTGKTCNHCGRNRVMNCANGKHVCEKCNWDNDTNQYSDRDPG
jgi:ribosomal protein L37AE/L43A